MALTACGLDGQWRFERDGQISTGDMLDMLMKECPLSNEEMLMVNVGGWGFIDDAWGMTCHQIHDLLTDYRQKRGDHWESLFGNPALSHGLPTMEGTQYAIFTSSRDDEMLPWQVLVDLTNHTIRFGQSFLTGSALSGTTRALSDTDVRIWMEALSVLTQWDGDQAWSSQIPDEMNADGWCVAVVASDSQLYRWKGRDAAPPDLQVVVDAFNALTR